MRWAIEQEGPARDAYVKATGNVVTEIGFVDHPRIARAGASPDGLVGEDGLIEIKCFNTANQIETLLNGDVDEKYRLQMVWQMACTGRNWCDFVSYDPRMPDGMQLFIKRFERDNKEIYHVENEVEIFLHEVDAKVKALEEKFGKRVPIE